MSRSIGIVAYLAMQLFAGVNSGTIFLYNDSPFILTATILASNGVYLGQMTVQPGQQAHFSQSLSPTSYDTPGTPEVSLTPYTVVWQCASADYYATCGPVSPGDMVWASGCPGTHFCKPKEKSSQGPASTLKKPSKLP